MARHALRGYGHRQYTTKLDENIYMQGGQRVSKLCHHHIMCMKTVASRFMAWSWPYGQQGVGGKKWETGGRRVRNFGEREGVFKFPVPSATIRYFLFAFGGGSFLGEPQATIVLPHSALPIGEVSFKCEYSYVSSSSVQSENELKVLLVAMLIVISYNQISLWLPSAMFKSGPYGGTRCNDLNESVVLQQDRSPAAGHHNSAYRGQDLP